MSANGWRPIETAPRDCTLMLLRCSPAEDALHPTEDGEAWRTIGCCMRYPDGGEEWQMAGWHWTQCRFVGGEGAPTHWQPLPGVEA